MNKLENHLIASGSNIKEALVKLNRLASDAILFVVTEKNELIGSLTDGDVRRGLIHDLSTNNVVDDFIQTKPKFIVRGAYNVEEIIKLREAQFKIIPILDKTGRIINILNLRIQKTYLPVDAVIMAGGLGSRLKPLTDTTPKPLLKIENKPIIEYNVDRLHKYGIDDLWISIRYLGEQIQDFFKDGSERNLRIKYIKETEPLGTIGAVSQVKDFSHDYILVTNSDILTTLDYEDFFLDFIKHDADMSVVTIPYDVKVPYAVMETANNHVLSFKEKPTYTYYSNGGIYLIKKSVLSRIPASSFYNSTDLMQSLIESKNKLISYPMRQYWLDIGKHEDFEKAQSDVKHLKF